MSDQLPGPTASNTFERIKRVNESGAEFWSSRDFAQVLGYTDYRNFAMVTIFSWAIDSQWFTSISVFHTRGFCAFIDASPFLPS